ncbi:hypothetical protein [Streptomyces sp. GS7]|uniref:hypothetical protein n=1 Tax=Streptomyces sp. GS7 TaxID=2692234 RepID=UPI001316BC70|nr:hypothetical protein [Streptomyces sp. GS7]QHC21981.1 hypothetical protein GR130_11625 [Streptomyces sp. GS7]
MLAVRGEAGPASGLLLVGCRTAVIVPSHDCLGVDLDTCADETARQCADVLYGSGGAERARWLLRRYPGALFVLLRAGGSRCVAVARTGVRAVTAVGDGRTARGWDPVPLASLLHMWVVALLPLEMLASAVFVCAGRTYRFTASSTGIRAGGG